MTEKRSSLPKIDSRKLLDLSPSLIIEANTTGKMPDGKRRITPGNLPQLLQQLRDVDPRYLDNLNKD